ncbi:M20 family peptidase [Robiginitalea sp. M366]|uniref:M20 family peptidase n=1 Tax=Robiginitalea aestuariiviva TaxID=3036903 RepID=UPI00240E425C|nr:M20 family peptidase [Robiginitalea aestuariiviva]MDG1572463.1 M20 family peptidase [Robiginitalea aestuariiviva]
MKKFLYILGAIILGLMAVLTFNTLRMTSRQVAPQALDLPEISEADFARLGGAVRFPTISYNEDAEPDSAAFRGFHQYLRETFPRVHQQLALDTINGYSLLYTWEGSDQTAKPVILMSHQDVVPVDQPTLEDWEAGPFEGRVTDTHIIGRGTLDDKVSLMGILESVERLLAEGFRPRQTLYLAFGHDEEVGGGNGAARIAEHLKAMGVQAAMTLDEGGFLAEGIVPGVEAPVAMVNLAEKGFASFRLIVETRGGHSSQPPRENTIGMLAQAIVDLENNQRPYKLVEPITYQFEYLGPELPFLKRMAFANPWLLKKPILKALNAHTTTAPTIVEGGVKNNVIPTVAEATINFRILPGETVSSVQSHIEATISDKVRVEPVGFLTDPSPVSEIDSDAFRTLEQTIRSVFPDAVVVPGLVGGGTDARYFYDLSDEVYRFYPIRIDSEGLTRFHGIDEKISKENYAEVIRFTHALIRALNQDPQTP